MLQQKIVNMDQLIDHLQSDKKISRNYFSILQVDLNSTDKL